LDADYMIGCLIKESNIFLSTWHHKWCQFFLMRCAQAVL